MGRWWINRAALPVLLLLAFALRLYRLGTPSLWWDESYGPALARRGLTHILLNTREFHPPLYYAALRFWIGWVGESEFALRFFSLAAGLVTVALVFHLGSRLLGAGAGRAAALAAALSPLCLAYSQEARMYSLETALALGAASLAWSLLSAPDPLPPFRAQAHLWGGYVALAAAALYTDYFPALALVSVNLFALGFIGARLARGRSWLGLGARWAGAQLAVLALYAPWFGALAGLQGYGSFQQTPVRIRSLLEQVWTGFNLGTGVQPEAAALYLWVAGGVLAIGLVAALRQRVRLGSLAFVALYLLVPVAAFVVATRSRPFFHVRYLLVATPGYYLLLGLALGALWRARRLLGVLAVFPLLVGWGVGANGYFFNPAFAKPQARPAGAFLREVAGAGDLLFWPPDHPLGYYYAGPATRAHFKATPTGAADRLTQLAQGHRRLFWEAADLTDNDPWGVVPFLLEKDAAPLGERTFPGYRLAWYALPAEPHFSLGELTPAGVVFGDRFALTAFGFGCPQDLPALPADRRPWAILQWQALTPVDRPFKFFVHLLDRQGHLVGQADSPLLDGRGAPTQYWTVGTSALSFANPALVPGLPPGRYRLVAGLYDAASGQRLGIVGGRSDTFDLGEVSVGSPQTPPSVEALNLTRRLEWTEGGVELLGITLAPGPYTLGSGENLAFPLYWRAPEGVTAEPLVRLWLQDGQGRAWGEMRARPVEGYPADRWQPGELLRGMVDYQVGPEVERGEYRLMLGLGERQVDITTIRVEGRARSYVVPEGVKPIGARFTGGAELAGFTLSESSLKPGGTVVLSLYWRGGESDGVSRTVFAHLLDGQNRIWAQHDGLPGSGRAPTTGWARGEVVEDRHEMAVRPDAPEGEYELEVGLYDARTGERLRLDSGEDRVVLGKLRVIK